MPALPQRTVQYVEFPVDTRHWDAFVHRPNDIFVCTPPKCGTTWTQAICVMLVQGRATIEGRLTDISPWLDQTFVPLAITLGRLDTQTQRRVIKTHTPLDGIPYFEECTYIAVYRDLRDAYMSGRNHLSNMREPDERLSDDPNKDFVAMMERPASSGSSLASLIHHYKTFKAFEHLDNVHLFHYQDLSRDLERNVKRLADVLDIQLHPSLLREIVEAASFTSMRSNFERYIPGAGSGRWHDETRFLNKGTHGQWRGVLRDEVLAQYDAMMHAQLTPEDVIWLQRGSD